MKFAVIGAGSIGKRHIGNLLEKGIAPGDIAVVDPREDRRAEIGQKFEIGTVGAEVALLDGLDLDGAFICSPTSMHIDQAAPLAERGINLLIEKPLDASLAGVDRLQRAVDAGKSQLVIAYCFRFSQHARKLRELVQDEVVGKPLYVHGEFSEYLPDWHPWEDYRTFYMAKKAGGGGSLLDQSHIIDIAHWVLGDIESVFAFNGNLSDLEVETDDYAEMMMRFRSGVTGVIHQDMFGRKHAKFLEIKCVEGNIYWDVYDCSVTVYDARSRTTVVHHTPKDHQIMYRNERDHFLDLCAGRADRSESSLAEGIHGMKIIAAAQRSSASGRLETVEG